MHISLACTSLFIFGFPLFKFGGFAISFIIFPILAYVAPSWVVSLFFAKRIIMLIYNFFIFCHFFNILAITLHNSKNVIVSLHVSLHLIMLVLLLICSFDPKLLEAFLVFFFHFDRSLSYIHGVVRKKMAILMEF